jgi:hypothetical protein
MNNKMQNVMKAVTVTDLVTRKVIKKITPAKRYMYSAKLKRKPGGTNPNNSL